MTRNTDEEGEWYLDSCALRHICNNYEIFVDFCPKSYKYHHGWREYHQIKASWNSHTSSRKWYTNLF